MERSELCALLESGIVDIKVDDTVYQATINKQLIPRFDNNETMLRMNKKSSSIDKIYFIDMGKNVWVNVDISKVEIL